ncbi:MAG: N-acetylglucosamine-6-phosphate deacetylase [Erysipelotrichaceae bacterium]|nr:N-acetylglucosamine-6-phosphate deacetylase [Erysipelotrichaceae bacterium]
MHSVRNGAVAFEEKVIRIVKPDEVEQWKKKADELIDGLGYDLLPGYIDVHVHGGYGYDFLEEPEKCLEAFSENALREGCTAYLASLVCASQEKLINAMRKYTDLKQQGARCLGIHMEGPFINPEQKAVMDPENIRLPDPEEFRAMISASNGNIRTMTIAPEMNGAMELIEYGTKNGVNMMLGHSNATSQQAIKAQEIGAFGITHLYNAMSQHSHRDPGLVTAALLDDSLVCELICDGFHVAPDVIRATIRHIGKRIALITDASLMRGLPDGDYVFSTYEVHKEGIKAQVKTTGRIAGSVVGMDDVCRNVCEFTDCSLNDIVRMASVNPAMIAGCQSSKGRLKKGYDADMILLDENMNVMSTYISGKCLYMKKS